MVYFVCFVSAIESSFEIRLNGGTFTLTCSDRRQVGELELQTERDCGSTPCLITLCLADISAPEVWVPYL
jgi:hypothetical protein